MGRPKIKLAILAIAIASTAYWSQQLTSSSLTILAVCAVWALLAMAAFRWERAEDWTYRLGSFLGIALATIEGVPGLLGQSPRSGLLIMAALHVGAFFLSVVGRFQKVSAKRVNRAL